MMKKKAFAVLALIVVISASLLLAHAYSISINDPVYEILPDVNPLLVDQPSPFGWRWYNGVLQRQNGFGTWAEVTSGTTLNQLFNDYDIATLTDVQDAALTIPDMVDALEQYFSSSSSFVSQSGGQNLPQILQTTRQAIGSFPFPYGRRRINSENSTTTNMSSLTHLFATIGSDLQLDLTNLNGTNYLNEYGIIGPSSINPSITMINSDGFMGIANRLSGNSGTVLFDTFIPGQAGTTNVNTLLDGISTTNSSLISMLTSTSSTILMPDGTAVGVNGRSSLGQISNYGFQGLATILRGASSNGSAIEWMDYSDLSTSVSAYSNLFDLNAAGFEHLQNLLALYMYSHGTDLDIQERENMQDQAQQFVDDFTSPDGKGTMSKGNMSDMANVSSSMGDNFSSSASVADIFTQLGSGNNYSFFSSEVLSDLEGNVPASLSVFDDGYVDFLNPHLDEFRESVGSLW